MEFLRNGLVFSPDDGGSGGGDENPGGNGHQDNPPGDDVINWDDWHKSLAPEAQELIKDRENGLKTALESEREARRKAEKDLREMAKAAEKGSDAEIALTQTADELAAINTKAEFYEEAHKKLGVEQII